MGIDGIGGGRPPSGPLGGATGPSKAGGEGFSVDRGSTTSATQQAGASADLERLQAGEISLNDYLQTRADKAVAHLEAVVPPDQLAVIKEQLIHQMKQDPTIATLVQRATGMLPSDNEG